MGSTHRSLAKVIKSCRQYQELARTQADMDEYWRGVYNGMEVLMSQLDVRESVFVAPAINDKIEEVDQFPNKDGTIY